MSDGWTIAPAVSAALGQATLLWPQRSRKSDGTIGDTAHGARASDHNPDKRGVVLAFDLTHDPANGCDAHALVRAAAARRDRRIKYAISQSHIWSAARAHEGWRPYSGNNPHDKHAHISVVQRWENDISPWWTTPPPAPPVPTGELDVDEKTLRRIIGEEVDKRVTILLRGETDGKATGHADHLKAIREDIANLQVPRKR